MISKPKTSSDWFQIGFLIIVAAFLYLDLFTLQGIPIAGVDLDQSFYLHNATRMLNGQIIYRDFFQFTTPGTELVYFSLFKLFGVHAWIPNVTVGALGLGLVSLAYSISKRIFTGASVCLSSLIFLVLSFHPSMDGSHHWFSMAAVTAATLLIFEKRTFERLAAAGMLCAVASFFTQTRGVGVVFAIALFLWWEHRNRPSDHSPFWKSEAVLGLSFLFATVGLNLYFVIQAGLRQYLWSIVVFPLRYYSADSELNRFHLSMYNPPRLEHFHYLPDPGWLLTYLLIPIVYLPLLIFSSGKQGRESVANIDSLVLLSLTGFALYVGIASAPIGWRMRIVAMPGLILLVWYLNKPGTLRAVARCCLWLAAIALAVLTVWKQQTRFHEVLETPTGSAAFFDDDAFQRIKWVAANTRPGESFFDCSGQAYFLLGLKSPAQVSFITDSDYMRPNQVQDLVASLERDKVRVILWCPALNRPVRSDDHLDVLRIYLQSHYSLVNVKGNLGVVLLRDSNESELPTSDSKSEIFQQLRGSKERAFN